MAKRRSKRETAEALRQSYVTKKCPGCFAHLPLDAQICHYCHKKVGDVDKIGFAEKPVDWNSYVIAIIAILAFCIFLWWAFFRE